MLSLPIPDQSGKITYEEMEPRGLDVAMLVSDLSKTATKQSTAHLDPDLDRTTLRRWRWRPAFGQSGAAATHLKNQNVDCGDLFLFFGWFRRVDALMHVGDSCVEPPTCTCCLVGSGLMKSSGNSLANSAGTRATSPF